MSDSLTSDADSAEGENSGAQSEQAQSQSGEQNTDWFYAENLPGQGERPEFLQSKFKSVEEQAKSYTELEKRFGGFKGAPENYEVKLQEELAGKVEINPENPLYKTFSEIAKAENMSNDTFNKIVNSYAKQVTEVQQANVQEELKKIGDNAGQRLGNLKRWAENSLDENEINVFHSLTTSAEAVLLFEKIKGMASEALAPITAATSKNGVTESDIHEMMKDQRYANGDKDYRRQVQEKIREHLGE